MLTFYIISDSNIDLFNPKITHDVLSLSSEKIKEKISDILEIREYTYNLF